MCSGNQSSFSNSLHCSPLCDGPHPEGKPSIRNPVINRGGELAPGIQQERSPTGGIRVVGRVGPDAGGGRRHPVDRAREDDHAEVLF